MNLSSTSPTKSPRRLSSGATIGSQRDFSSLSSTNYNDSKLYQQFKQEVEQGKFKASDSDIKNLVLIPHFEPFDINYVPSEDPIHVNQSITKKIDAASKAEPKLVSGIKEATHAKSKKLYESQMNEYYKDIQLKSKSQQTINHIDLSMNRVLVTDSLNSLKKHLIILKNQNEALNSHILLLTKAKQQLTIQKQSLIQATKWQKREIAKILGSRVQQSEHPY